MWNNRVIQLLHDDGYGTLGGGTMAVCRICGAEFNSRSYNCGYEICGNGECWEKAWDDAIAPLRRLKKEPEERVRKRRHQTTPAEKRQIMELFNQGVRRLEIAELTKVSYPTVVSIINRYKKGGI